MILQGVGSISAGAGVKMEEMLFSAPSVVWQRPLWLKSGCRKPRSFGNSQAEACRQNRRLPSLESFPFKFDGCRRAGAGWLQNRGNSRLYRADRLISSKWRMHVFSAEYSF